MNIFKRFESSIAGLVEGTFSRAFRSKVRPIEIARKLAREMEQHRTAALSQTYVPNHYRVYLSEADYTELTDFEDELREELETFLLEHARSEKLALAVPPVVEFSLDQDLKLGAFGIETIVDRKTKAKAPTRRSVPQPSAGVEGTMIYTQAKRLNQNREANNAAYVAVGANNLPLDPRGSTVGRSRDCNITLEDPNISRKHLSISYSGGSWIVEDLNSTNGVLLNGQRISGSSQLQPGDSIKIGSSKLLFQIGSGS